MDTSKNKYEKCPRCGSTEIKTQKWGKFMWSRFIGMGKISGECLKCKHKF
jgi:hypothetical protein